jgi:hypothetical protein
MWRLLFVVSTTLSLTGEDLIADREIPSGNIILEENIHIKIKDKLIRHKNAKFWKI